MAFNIDVAIASGAGAGTNVVNLVRDYTPGVLVRDAVFQKSDGKVDRTNASSISTSETFVGFVEAVDLPLAGQATIRAGGDLTGFSGLTPGAVYILSLATGSIVKLGDTLDPNYPDSTGEIILEVGIAKSASILFVQSGREFEEI